MAAPSSVQAGTLVVDPVLLEKYRFGGDCYPSYPAADRFGPQFGPSDALRQLSERGASGEPGAVSAYVHLPFCETDCPGCAGEDDRRQVAQYLSYLEREIVTQRGALGRDEEVAQLRWAGGTATFLTPEESFRLWEILGRYFALAAGGEFSIDLDPRRAATPVVERFGAQGFNRLTLAVHDFDPAVQARIDRVHPAEETGRAVMAARASGFRAVSFEMMLGLPGQSARSVAGTIDTALRMQPDRIALCRFVHRPEQFAAHARIGSGELPSQREEARMLAIAVAALTGAGYACSGAGRFELPACEQSLGRPDAALQQEDGERSSQARLERLGFGISAISAVGRAYSQNHCTLRDYCASLERGELPVSRGHRLSDDDLLRREVIRRLTHDFRLEFEDLGARFGTDFGSYFGRERGRLEELEQDGLIERSPAGIEVTSVGRLLADHIAMTFDRYPPNAPDRRETPARLRC